MKWSIAGLVISIVNTLQAMEQSNKPRLNFLIDSMYRITRYSAENMAYPLEPSQFIGKNLFIMLPLSEKDKAVFCNALELVAQEGKSTKISSTIQKQEYSTTITIFNKPSCGYDLCIKMKPVKK